MRYIIIYLGLSLSFINTHTQAPKSRGIYRIISSENNLSTDTIVQRIISNRETFEKRNRNKQLKELRIIEAEKKRRESEREREEIEKK